MRGLVMKIFIERVLSHFFYTFLFLCLVSCGGSSEDSSSPSPSDSSPASSEVILEEPTVLSDFSPQLISTLNETENEKKRPIKLNGLVENVKDSVFYINDYILFDEDTLKKHEAAVKFHITTKCIEPEKQNQFEKKMVLDYQNKLTLVQLIPEEMFFYGNPWWLDKEERKPVCSFQFTSKNSKGDSHYFELPQLIIESFEDSFNLSLIQQNIETEGKERIKQFPILDFENLSKYAVISGSSEINEIKLICEKINLSFKAGGVKHYDLWKLQGWGDISDENKITQACRFVSFNDNMVLGVSQLFPLVFPQKTDISLEFVDYSELPANEELERKTQGLMDLKNNFRNQSPNLMSLYHRVAGLKIKNKGLDQVHLYIPEASFDVNSDFIFKGSAIRDSGRDSSLGNDYPAELIGILYITDIYPLSKTKLSNFFSYEKGAKVYFTSQMLAENTFVEKDKNLSDSSVTYGSGKSGKILMTLNPGHEWIFPLSLEVLESCLFSNISGYKKFSPLAMVFEGLKLPAVYQVLSNKDFESAEKTKVKNISWSKKNEKESSFYLQTKVYRGILPSNSRRERGDKMFFRNTCEMYKAALMNFWKSSQSYMYRLEIKDENLVENRVRAREDDYHLLKVEDGSIVSEMEDFLIERQLERR